MTNYLAGVTDPASIVTAIDSAVRFPEILDALQAKYAEDINLFRKLIDESETSATLLERIRSQDFHKDQRMSLLKMFRRCVSPVLDTEMTKKIRIISTERLIENFGETFKPIKVLKEQFRNLSNDKTAALAALIGEYDSRGQLGYALTNLFFDWFEQHFEGVFTIVGPRGAGPDIELSTLFLDFKGSYPCDFVIRDNANAAVVAVGFARYDSTRGGAQSDDRTGGNSDKVSRARDYLALSEITGQSFRMLFLSDGPGLIHKDTWAEACNLDGAWDGNVRVVTLKTAAARIGAGWLRGVKS